jgi:hypothetical protein
MTDAPNTPPSAAKLLRRLATPSPPTALESLGLPEAAAPMGDARQRLDAAERLLKRLAAGTSDIDEATIDRIIRDAEEALKKLDGEGDQAPLSEGEAFGLEAVIEADGSRPVLFVQDNTIDLEAPDLKDSLAERWQVAAREFLPGIRKVAASVGAVQLPAFGNRRFGTAFLIKPGYVVTNRHVLEEAARFVDGAWEWKYKTEVDFLGEYQRPGENRFPLGKVVFWGPNPINRRINFANLDLVVIQLGGDLAKQPHPLTLERRVETVRVQDGVQPPVHVVGFPAKPEVLAGEAGAKPPRAGHEYEAVLEKLYGSLSGFGSKRWAPGLVEAGAGQLAGDARLWVMSHDASTLGGNSGSCVVDFGVNGERVVGLHFGGQPRVENYAHVVAALREVLAPVDGLNWV